MKEMDTLKITEVTPKNASTETLFCIKDILSPGFNNKLKWFEKRHKEGLKMKILKDESDRMIGFIEYVPANNAWRPVNADNFMFIHCIAVYSKKDRSKGYGSILINEAINDAKEQKMSGVCVMVSKGTWIANSTVFQKNNFKTMDKKGRFELLSIKWDEQAKDPKLFDWTQQQKKYQGWHLLYANQCPWHEKSVSAIMEIATNYGIYLNIEEILTPRDAKNAPSGYGVFNLLHDGKLLEDHYISATRFVNIVKKELGSTIATKG